MKLFLVVFKMIISSVIKKPIRNCHGVIFHNHGSEVIKSALEPLHFETLTLKVEELRFFIALQGIIWKLLGIDSFTDSYIRIFLKKAKPKFLITFVDEDPNVFRIQQKFDLPTIIIQNGLRQDWLKNSKEDLHVERLFVLNSSYAEYFGNYINGKIIPIGSLKNNEYLSKRIGVVTKNLDIEMEAEVEFAFISTFTDPLDAPAGKINLLGSGPVSWEEFHRADLIALAELKKICRVNNYNLSVIGCFNYRKESEYDLFGKLLEGIKWKFIPRENFSSYQELENASLIFTVDSTLGFEALAQQKKVFFMSYRAKILGLKDRCFGWPDEYPETGSFWMSESNQVEFESKVMDCLSKQYAEIYDPNFINRLIALDDNHKLLRSEIGILFGKKY
ncbi:Surface carbohydrate biosynthesis protein, Leptospira [Candidatus Nanopelagicaceae bacterium]